MAKTMFITGASTGIGKVTAELFAGKGWHVIATMRNPDAAADWAKQHSITLLPLDVTKPEQISEAVKQAVASGGVDVLINNAGYGTMGPLEGTSDEDVRRIIDTNLYGVIQLTKAFLPQFRERKGGVIISVTSIGGLVAYPFFSLYHATKWAVEGWTESMAFELKPFNIQIKTVQPGPTQTDFASRSLVMPEHEAYRSLTDQFKTAFFSDAVMESLAPASDVAAVILEAATDGKTQLRYLAGSVANAEQERRLNLGAEAYHSENEQLFLKA